MKRCAWAAIALPLCGCSPDLPAARQADVARVLANDLVLPMGKNVVVLSRASDCGTQGETGTAVSAALFAAFMAANDDDAAPLDLGALAPQLRVDSSGMAARALNRRQRRPVVALSRVGIDGDEALACVEVFSVDERGFFVLLRRDYAGAWSIHAELEAWRVEAAANVAEELPDGTPYRE